jgi:deoxyribonuclease IV
MINQCSIYNAKQHNLGIHLGNLNEIMDKKNKNIKLFQFFVDPIKNDYFSPNNKILERIKKNNIQLVAHSSYTINVSKNWDEHSWWVEYIVQEILLCQKLGVLYLVIHTGKKLDLPTSIALNNMYSFIIHVIRRTEQTNVKILIETPSGQGSELLADINDFCKFITKFSSNEKNKNRVGICLDTCHIFAAGYDIRKKNIFNDFLQIINNIIGKDTIKLIHLNDSKGDMGSKLDRHQNIGMGKIGKKSMEYIIKKIGKLNVPMILETPSEYIHEDFALCKRIMNN